MADCISSLRKDLAEQFKGKANIESLIETVGVQLQEVYDFYESLLHDRDVYTAVGKNLDGVGDIAVLTRKEAGQLAGSPIPFPVMDDETYRLYLIYKILKNTCDCTYPNIIKAFKMFWDKPLYYSESPDQPATMIFDTGWIEGWADTSPLFKIPLLRAAGVTLKLIARTSTTLDTVPLPIVSGLGYALTETRLPELEREYDFTSKLYAGSFCHSVSEDTLPHIERGYKFNFKLNLGSSADSIAEDTLPFSERNIDYGAKAGSGSAVHSVMETPLSGIAKQNN